ncbi:protein kinase [Neophaeococcomyces mojaviensis]|uniref:Protein kinase n=1 Tax=Neophaeococcomyces mojaviensis TaxID=3383035 RepID=A0ACC3AK45_9EURO|nr:protein kinase [Knufia sp. JES_112]
MNAVYDEEGAEFSFEELRALHRGWTGMNWRRNRVQVLDDTVSPKVEAQKYKSKEPQDLENLTSSFEQKLDISEPTPPSQESVKGRKTHKQKKLKMREIKQETQTIKTRLDSPPKPKLRKKMSAEPTMTFNSKVAHNEIYDMYNHAQHDDGKDDTQSGAETDFEDDTFSMAGESVGTGRISTANSESGDETISSVRSFGADDTNASPWSDFTTGKISKVLKKARSTKHKPADSEDLANMTSSQDQIQNGFDTQAIADIANQDFGELDTMAIARIAGNATEEDDMTGTDREEEDEDLQTPIEPSQLEPHEAIEKSRYIPIPPEDYGPTPMRPYRDPQLVAHNKLPFMTPIVEHTESSLAPLTIFQGQEYSTAKTPSRAAGQSDFKYESPSKLKVDTLLLESPVKSVGKRKADQAEDEAHSPKKVVAESPIDENQKILFPVIKSSQPIASSTASSTKGNDVFKTPSIPSRPVEVVKKPIHKGPIIQDLQCNPCDEGVIGQILKTVHPAPSTYPGFHQYEGQDYSHFSQIRSFVQKLAKQNIKGSPRKGPNEKTKLVSPTLEFDGTTRVYAVKRELGEGAFAPVYLVDSCEKDLDNANLVATTTKRGAVEAIKAENEPKTLTWEFHILHLLKTRLGRSSRAMESIVLAHECHLYRDECYLVLDYHSQGTLLDLVNQVRNENIRSGKTAEGLEEPVVMWLAVELLRTMEDIHKVGILHGDMKADNCLVRLDVEVEVSGAYSRHGHDGWNKKGLTLIDFGRGIDVKAFKPEARFIADWKAQETDCPEIREAKPWKWEIDLFGAAGVIHSLLFGKYIETVSVSGGGLGQKKEWKLRENFKRYWEKDIWTEVFSVLINGGGKKEDEVRRDLQRIRSTMEDWLEKESERNGRDLRAALRRCERLVGAGATKGRR